MGSDGRIGVPLLTSSASSVIEQGDIRPRRNNLSVNYCRNLIQCYRIVDVNSDYVASPIGFPSAREFDVLE